MSVIETNIVSACQKYDRKVWWYQGPKDQMHRLAVFLDAEHYLRDMNVVPLIDDLVMKNVIAPMSMVFISHQSRDDRHADLVCSEDYASYIANDVVAWARERSPRLQSENHFLGGVSLSGLQSAYTALLYPNLFTTMLCQSGSFWWKPDWFAEQARQRAPIVGRYWLSVGNLETDTNVSHPPTGLFQAITQIEGVVRAVQSLKESGATAHYHFFEGGHAFEPWRAEFTEALTWLLQPSAAVD